MAVGQNQWYNFGVGAPPILVHFSGDWDVHWGYNLAFDPWPHGHILWACFFLMPTKWRNSWPFGVPLSLCDRVLQSLLVCGVQCMAKTDRTWRSRKDSNLRPGLILTHRQIARSTTTSFRCPNRVGWVDLQPQIESGSWILWLTPRALCRTHLA